METRTRLAHLTPCLVVRDEPVRMQQRWNAMLAGA
jgi:hypothetical protein